MIKIKRVEEVPPEIFNSASTIADRELLEGKLELRVRLAFSSHMYLAIDKGVPLFVAGAFKFSNFDDYLEVWMIGTSNLKIGHLHKLKKLFNMWLATREERIFAQAQTRQAARFLEFFGFELVDFSGSNMVYEVKR